MSEIGQSEKTIRKVDGYQAICPHCLWDQIRWWSEIMLTEDAAGRLLAEHIRLIHPERLRMKFNSAS